MGILSKNGGTENTGGHGGFRNPHQIAIDSLGFLYLPDKGGVLRFSSSTAMVSLLENGVQMVREMVSSIPPMAWR